MSNAVGGYLSFADYNAIIDSTGVDLGSFLRPTNEKAAKDEFMANSRLVRPRYVYQTISAANLKQKQKTIVETNRRREIQQKYNEEHGIVPKTIVKKVSEILEITTHSESEFKNTKKLSKAQRQQLIESLTKEMKAAARLLEFEHAAYLRDKIKKLRGE